MVYGNRSIRTGVRLVDMADHDVCMLRRKFWWPLRAFELGRYHVQWLAPTSDMYICMSSYEHACWSDHAMARANNRECLYIRYAHNPPRIE